jgi:hydrogenase-4 membrane subunit HyfE
LGGKVVDLFTFWVVVALILFTIWIGIVRETRLALMGYILQMISVLALYMHEIIVTKEYGAFIGWGAMAAIRLIAIPILIRVFLRDGWWHERVLNDVVQPRTAVLIYALLAAFGFVMGSYAMKSAVIGGAIGMLLLGIGIVLLKHDPSKQIFGLLSADTAADLLIIEIMDRMTYVTESLIYLSVFLATLCLVILVKAIETRTNGRSTKHLTNLKG